MVIHFHLRFVLQSLSPPFSFFDPFFSTHTLFPFASIFKRGHRESPRLITSLSFPLNIQPLLLFALSSTTCHLFYSSHLSTLHIYYNMGQLLSSLSLRGGDVAVPELNLDLASKHIHSEKTSHYLGYDLTTGVARLSTRALSL